MNLSEALDAALPEIPKVRAARSRPPCLDPELITREDMADGEPFIGVMHRGRASYFRLPPSHWQLAQLFDGVRSYEEIAALYGEQTQIAVSAGYLRDFVQNFEDAGLWYKTPQEKNLALNEKLRAQRERRATRKSKVNLAHISFSAWDPDRYLGWLDRRAGWFIYSPWCVLAVVMLFIFEGFVFVAKWNVIGPDIPLYFNFTQKGFYDIVEFWILLFALGFIHETAHGLTCKHYGGEVHSMGLMFLYLTPCFFADITEAWVSTSRLHRMAAIIAGIWIEMVVCGVAMVIWTNTAPGLWLHDFCYKVILITGLAVIVMNLNPLLKLDGYYFLTEFLTIPDLKEDSTAFVSGWFQRHILRLPVDVPVIPRRRLALYTVYALISGAYSYFVLYAVIRFVYNVSSHWLAEFALIPAGMMAFAMFKSRLVTLRGTLARAWKNGLGSGPWWRPKSLLITITLLVLLLAPIWRDRENAYFLVEAQSSSAVHAALTGRVESVFVKEGDTVRAGQPLLRMTSSGAASMRSAAQADTSDARFRAFDAELRGASISIAASDQEAALRSTDLARNAQASLVVTAPSDGIVLTADPASLRDQNVSSGELLIDLANPGARVVKLFIPVSALDRIPANAEAALILPGRFSVLRLNLGTITPETVTLPDGIIAKQAYKGVVLPTFYSARMPLPAADANLKIGLAGSARIFGVRRSLVARFFGVISNLFHAHVW